MNRVGALLLILFISVQWFVTRSLLRWAGRRWRAAIYGFGVLMVLGYVCTMSDLVARLKLPASPAAVFGAFAFCYFGAATAMLAIRFLRDAIARHPRFECDAGRRRVLNAAGNVLMTGPFVVIGYGALVQRTDFHVREFDMPVAGLARDLDGLRLLQISDIHLSAFLSEAELARVIDASFELRPHVAVVTGDLISGRDDPLDACIRQLARVKADAGVLGCMGNHERYAGVEEETAKKCARVGIRFLRSEAQALRFGNAVLNIAGVDYQSLAGNKVYLRGAERLIVPGACNLLLSHNPDVLPVAARQGYNLVLAGHTHGGQVTVEILDQAISPARFLTPYVYGVYRKDQASAYVTRGIGTIGIPARIGAPPEICLLRLRKA